MKKIERILIQADLDYHKLEKDGSGDLEEWSSFIAKAIHTYILSLLGEDKPNMPDASPKTITEAWNLGFDAGSNQRSKEIRERIET